MKRESGRSALSKTADRNLRRAVRELDALSKELSVPEAVTSEAARICKKALKEGLGRRKQTERIAASSLYAACREREVPASLDDVAAASGVGRKELAKFYRQLVNQLDLRIPVADPAEYMSRVASRANASEEVRARAIEILSRAEKAGVAAGRYPKGLAASALYIASALEGQRMTQKGAADAAGVREATLRKEYKRLGILSQPQENKVHEKNLGSRRTPRTPS
jgi:transcription initiation factor TFIIB